MKGFATAISSNSVVWFQLSLLHFIYSTTVKKKNLALAGFVNSSHYCKERQRFWYD